VVGCKSFVNWFSVTPPGRWLARRVILPIDPLVYRLSGGRLTAAGPPTIRQIVLTTVGRKSGRERGVQLGFIRDGACRVPVRAEQLSEADKALVLAEARGGGPAVPGLRDADRSEHPGIQAPSDRVKLNIIVKKWMLTP
jgi:hypothetical protein